MTDEQYMRRCLELAEKGAGYVAPNPMVGAVIVHNDVIIGEGYHQQYGQAHAEVNAIHSVRDKSLLSEATIYVSLEPCAHFGKTPPCSDLIVKSNIPRVVIACQDPFSEVAGKGIEKLRKAGCDVKTGILEIEALDLNKRFFTYHLKKRPYVILKWAQTPDGFMDIDRSAGNKGTFWITQPETQQLVHKWRHEEAGILVGKNTVLNDNPELTVRTYKGNSPSRFFIDSSQEIRLEDYEIGQAGPPTHRILSTNIPDILKEVSQYEILSLLVEGGRYTLDRFLESNLWDEARVITGTTELKKGMLAPTLNKVPVSSYYYGKDLIQIYTNV